MNNDEDIVRSYIERIKIDDERKIIPAFDEVIQNKSSKRWYLFAASLALFILLLYGFHNDETTQGLSQSKQTINTPESWDQGQSLCEWTSPTNTLLNEF